MTRSARTFRESQLTPELRLEFERLLFTWPHRVARDEVRMPTKEQRDDTLNTEREYGDRNYRSRRQLLLSILTTLDERGAVNLADLRSTLTLAKGALVLRDEAVHWQHGVVPAAVEELRDLGKQLRTAAERLAQFHREWPGLGGREDCAVFFDQWMPALLKNDPLLRLAEKARTVRLGKAPHRPSSGLDVVRKVLRTLGVSRAQQTALLKAIGLIPLDPLPRARG